MSKNVNNDVNVNPFIETVGATMTAPKTTNKQTNMAIICLPFLPGNFLKASYLLKICIPVKVPNANISF